MITPDLIARALVGAAYVCKVSPLEVFADRPGHSRARILAAAALRGAGLGTRETMRRIFHIAHSNQLSPSMLAQARITDVMVRAVMAGAGLVDATPMARTPRPIPQPRPAAPPTFRQAGLSHARGKSLSAGQQAIFDAMLDIADGEWIVAASLVHLERLASAPPYSAANRLWGLRRKGYVELVVEPTSHAPTHYRIAEAHRPTNRAPIVPFAPEPARAVQPVRHARAVPPKRKPPEPRFEPAPAPAPKPKPAPPARPPRPDVVFEDADGETSLPVLGANLPANAKPVAFCDRAASRCAWPIESTDAPGSADMLVCGAPSEVDGPYCPSHAARAYTPSKRPPNAYDPTMRRTREPAPEREPAPLSGVFA